MNVLLISTSDAIGGGAIAAHRLMDALNRHGVKARMLVRDKVTDSICVARTGSVLPKLAERLHVLCHNGFDRRRMWLADTACAGIDITRTQEFREADVIHLHWVNQGMLSLHTLERILQSGKRVVWTLHDEWPALGVCHYRGECTSLDCSQCPLMKDSLPHQLWQRKRDIYRQGRITFVGCSQWITGAVAQALPGEDVRHISNCVPHDVFTPMDQRQARMEMHLPQNRPIVLFCSQRVTDERKGMRFLDEALQFVKTPVEVVRIGRGGRQINNPADMARMYAAADCFVTPSLQDNLPNTIAEAMSCGTPCVGFRVGGIPEMITHRVNGYVADYQSSNDLAQGIEYVLSHPELRMAALHHARMEYEGSRVAAQYIKVYEE